MFTSFNNFIEAFVGTVDNEADGRVTEEGLNSEEKAELNNIRNTQESLKNRIKLTPEEMSKRKPTKSKSVSKESLKNKQRGHEEK